MSTISTTFSTVDNFVNLVFPTVYNWTHSTRIFFVFPFDGSKIKQVVHTMPNVPRTNTEQNHDLVCEWNECKGLNPGKIHAKNNNTKSSANQLRQMTTWHSVWRHRETSYMANCAKVYCQSTEAKFRTQVRTTRSPVLRSNPLCHYAPSSSSS